MHEIAKSGGLEGSENLSRWQHKLHMDRNTKKKKPDQNKNTQRSAFCLPGCGKIILTVHACSALMERISIFVMIQNTPKAAEDVQGTG